MAFLGGDAKRADPAVTSLLAQLDEANKARRSILTELTKEQAKVTALQTQLDQAQTQLAAARRGQKASRERANRFKAALVKKTTE
jgi:recombinational DNA repair ATPase RecF